MFDMALVGELAGMVGRLADVPSAVGDDGVRVDVIAELERLKACGLMRPATQHVHSLDGVAGTQDLDASMIAFARSAGE